MSDDLLSKPNIQPGLVSIMMPAFNAAAYIQAAVESILAQTYPNWELLIVNDGSTDATAAILNLFHDQRIRIFEQPNRGEAVARNRALQEAQGEWLAFLDADDQFLSDYLEKALAFLKERPDLNAVYTDGLYIDSSGKVFGKLSDQRRGPFEGNLLEPLIRSSDVFGPPICVLVNRRVLTEHPTLFDERIVIGPDWDFFTQVAQYANFGYLDVITCRYRIHQTNITLQTGSHKRRESLTFCREKAIHLPGFSHCTQSTQEYVFYDLLINLLAGQPEVQNSVLQWAEFQQLPDVSQARLCRLLAMLILSKEGYDNGYAHIWLDKAYSLYPHDPKTRWLARLYALSPRLLTTLLQMRDRIRRTSIPDSPLAWAEKAAL